MPTVQVNRDQLFKSLGQTFTDEAFDKLCFDYGIELDGITNERELKLKETGINDPTLSDETIYKIDVPANRYDLLCLEGLSRALKVYGLGAPIPQYRTVEPTSGTYQKLTVVNNAAAEKNISDIRPVVVCGILRDITFTQEIYDSFIDLQEKLHQNICKKRTLASVGTHDLDKITGPFTYTARTPQDIKFVALSETQALTAHDLFEKYDKTSSHLKKFLHIIQNEPVYPVICDSKETVLSLPPIINGDHSKITLATKNVFIEVTATDKTKANIVLNIMLTMFSEYCAIPYTMEKVEVVDVNGASQLYPQIDEVTVSASTDYINKAIGINIQSEEMVEMLKKMSLNSVLSADKSTIGVSVPCTRSDIIHQCDIMEDVAIGYGFNNIERVIPKTHTTGRVQPINKLSELLANEIAMAGFTEVMTFVLCSGKDNNQSLNRADDNTSVRIGNYLHEDFSEVRTNLISTLMRSVASNKAAPLPLKLFEISDVSVKGSTGNTNLADPDSNNSDVGAINKRMLGAVHCNMSSKLEVVHGLLDKIMLSLNIKPDLAKSGKGYYLVHSTDKVFIPGMGTDVIVNGKKIGIMGTVHPQVLKNYGVLYPCSLLELEVTMDLAKLILARE
eukprot:gene14962-17690_t